MGKFATETGEYTDIGDHHGRRWRASAFVFFFWKGSGGRGMFFWGDTVDGRNPAPPGMYKTL